MSASTTPAINLAATNSTNGGSATLTGIVSGQNPSIAGHDLVYYYTYALCASYPGSAVQTPNATITSAPVSGTLPGVPVSGLPSGQAVCHQACVVDKTVNGPAVCGATEQFVIPLVDTTAPVGVGATNSSSSGGFATFTVTYANVTAGHNISTYYKYGPCPPPLALQTAAVATTNAAASGSTANAPTTGLPLNVSICYQSVSSSRLPTYLSCLLTHPSTCTTSYPQCETDLTDGSGPFCGDIQTFRIPVIETLPATNVGATNNTAIGGYATLPGSWAGATPGDTLATFYKYGDCQTYPTGSSVTPNTTVTNAQATGTMTSQAVTGLPAGADTCFQAVRT